jgi:hypothetical protein
MLKWLLRRRLAAFERAYDYDVSYARDILDADPGALWRFSKVMGMAHYRRDVPAAAWCAAGIVGTLSEDCGPCTQLGVTMAEREGVDPATLQAVLERDVRAMPDDVSLAYRFAVAALARDVQADDLRAEVLKRWGPRGLVSLAFAITAARMFPTLKYALGHGRSCTRVRVGGAFVPVAHPQEA